MGQMPTSRIPGRSVLFLSGFALSATLLLVAVTSAEGAVNAVPNPSFENGCGTNPVIPCQWDDPGFQVSIEQDLSIARTGSASLKFTLNAGTFDSDISDCVNASVPAG